MSGGRIELGLGAGWNRREHDAYGIPFHPRRERFDRLERTTRGDHRPVVDVRGRAVLDSTVATTRSPTRPRSRNRPSRPRPPIVMGGFGAEADSDARRPLRRRVQRAVRTGRLVPFARAGRTKSLRCDRARTDDAARQCRVHRGVRRGRRDGGAPGGGGRPRARPARGIRGGGYPGAGRGQAARLRRGRCRDRLPAAARPPRPRSPTASCRRGASGDRVGRC